MEWLLLLNVHVEPRDDPSSEQMWLVSPKYVLKLGFTPRDHIFWLSPVAQTDPLANRRLGLAMEVRTGPC